MSAAEAQANGYLIAAAPDMLVALQALVDVVHIDAHVWNALQQAEAAITKATGGQA
jgi:hypothetical protein